MDTAVNEYGFGHGAHGYGMFFGMHGEMGYDGLDY
jgi:hypothetical protein